jgi:chromosome partitioning protein
MLVAVVSKKGGVGKTTTAVNLAAGLAERGKKTLLIDLDPQASASLSIGIPRERLAPSSSDLLLADAEAHEVLRHTRFQNLDLITSSADLVHADRELACLRRPEERLRSKLASIQGDYDYVVCDCPPGLSTLPASALVAADTYLVPITPHFLAIEGLRNFLQAVDRLGIRHQLGLRCLGIALTVVDYRTKVTRVNVQRLREEFGGRVFAVEVRTAIKLAEAPAFGQSIFEYAPKSPPAQSLAHFCDEFVLRAERLAGEHHEPPTRNVTTMEGNPKFERKHWVPGTRAVRG